MLAGTMAKPVGRVKARDGFPREVNAALKVSLALLALGSTRCARLPIA